MSTPAAKPSQGKPHSATAGKKPKGKHLSLTEYKRQQQAKLDRFRKECGA